MVNDAATQLRQHYTWLRQQDAIGVGILLLALGGMLLVAYGHVRFGWSPWWVIPLAARLASLTHELGNL